MVSSRKKILSFAITALGLLALFLVAVNTGSLKVMPLELFKGLFIEYNENVATIYDLRFPRILIAIFGGAATAVSGVLLQAVMKNPLADPGIIGVSSGASLTAVEMLASSTAITEMTIRLLVTFTPRERAVLSSSASRLHCPITKTEAIRPMTT